MQRQKRSLIFIPFLSEGGAEKQGILLAKHLSDHGHAVTVWGFGGKKSQEVERILHTWGIKTGVFSPWPPYPSFTRPKATIYNQIRAIIDEARYRSSYSRALPEGAFDFAIPFTPWPGLVLALFRRKLGEPLTAWNHRGGDDDGGFEYNSGLVERIEKASQTFVANSRAGGDFLSRTFPKAKSQHFVIPNFYDGRLTTPDDATRKAAKIGSPIRLTHIANAFTEKDIPTAIRGAKLLTELGHSVKLTLVGGYPYKGIEREINELISTEHLEGIVEKLGPLDQRRTHQLLTITDIGILSSRSEGTPNAVMEFMAHGVPVVGTRIPGIQDLVGARNQDFLFPVGDPQGLCDAVSTLIRNTDIRTELVTENLRCLRVNHSTDNVGPKWLEALRC